MTSQNTYDTLDVQKKFIGGYEMKSDVALYRKIYENLKYKIECGLLPGGYQLPSRAEMCKEFETSEKPVRCAIEMLVRDGLVETKKRRRPMVAYHQEVVHRAAGHSMRKAAATAANDALTTGVFLCYPVIGHGISLCRGEDWVIPETILEHMDPEQTTKFWRLSSSFWRFFVKRNGNELILRTVDSMGYSKLDALIGSYEVRAGYFSKLKEFLQTVKNGGDPASVQFDDMSSVYGFSGEQKEDTPTYQVPSDSVFFLGAKELEEKIRGSEERYSGVYLDIIGLISMGYYKRGDYLPSHKELQDIYDVSIDTTLKAIKTLKEWRVVETAPHKGIWVTMDAEELKQVYIDPKLVACHVRRFLDSLELLTLTMEGVTAHAMENVSKEEIERFCNELGYQWKDPLLFHFFPSMVLQFVTAHIKYDMLRSIYEVLRKNFRIGRSIPKMIGSQKTTADRKNYRKCLSAMEVLKNGEVQRFAVQITVLFQDIRSQIIEACEKIGYLEAAMQVYDGTELWK